MTIRQVIQVLALRRRWIVGCVAVFLILASALTILRPAEYTSSIALYVSAQGVESATSAYQGGLLSEQRVQSYADLATSPRVTREIIRSLGLSTTDEDLASRIRASASQDTVILSISVNGATPLEAASIANQFGAIFPPIVAELERPLAANVPAPVVVRVIDSATVPIDRSNSGWLENLSLGFLIGVAFGIALAFLRQSLDTSVRDGDTLATLGAGPLLGTASRSTPEATEAAEEEFRRIRTNFQYIEVDNPPRVLLLTSALASEGKTSSCIRLAEGLVASGSSVVVVDADLRRPTVAGVLGLEPRVGLTTVLSQRVAEREAIQRLGAGGFSVLASGASPPNPGELLGSKQMASLLSSLRERFDYVLIDTAPVVPVADTLALVPLVDGAIFVARYGQTRRADIEAAVAAVNRVQGRIVGCLLNMVPAAHRSRYEYAYSKAVPVDSPIAGSDFGSPNTLSEEAITNQLRPRPQPRRRE